LSSGEPDRVSLSLQSLIDARLPALKSAAATRPPNSHYPGVKRGVKRGQGIEFADLRRYVAGDDVRHIDWKVTARSNQPHTRLYVEEREQTTRVAIDFRPCMFTGSERLRAVAAGRFAAALLWRSAELGDRCAASVISVNGIEHSRPATGADGVLAACELLSRCFANAQAVGKGVSPELSTLLDWFNSARRKSGSFFLLSGFDTRFDDNWLSAVAAAGVSRRVTAIMVLDPIEVSALPAGTYRYRADDALKIAILQTTDRDTLDAALQEQLNARQKPLLEHAIPVIQTTSSQTEAALLAELQHRALL
jgi:uncharacterized protein (DUF58 family)